MNFPITLFSRWIPRGISVFITLIFTIGILTGVAAVTIPILSEQGRQAIQKFPKAFDRAEGWFYRARYREPVLQGTKGEKIQAQIQEEATKAIGAIIKKTIPVLTSSVEAVIGTLFIIILAAFLAHQPGSYRKGLKSLVPNKYQPVFDELWNQTGFDLRRWLQGTLVSMTIMGSLTAAGLWLVGLEQWPLLGLLTFFGTFIPYLGAISSAIPGLLLGLADSGTTFIYTLLVYLAVHIVEGYIIQPIVMKRAVEISPGILLLWQSAITALLGVLGVIVATPLLVCLRTFIHIIYIERTIERKQ